ncbi:hypothetical protein [Streptomyces mirabilis]
MVHARRLGHRVRVARLSFLGELRELLAQVAEMEQRHHGIEATPTT